MPVRALVAASALAACAACGGQIHPAARGLPSSGPTTTTSFVDPTPYANPQRQAVAASKRFVRTALSYDAPSQEELAFLKQVRSLATPAEQSRIRHSARTDLDWSALRARHESTKLRFTGASMDTATSKILIQAERTTHTSFGDVNDFIDVVVGVVQMSGEWKVASATGAGL
jgi:hypothetical protein